MARALSPSRPAAYNEKMNRTRTLLVAVATAVLLGGGLPTAGAGPGQLGMSARPLDWHRTADPVVLRPSTVVRDIECPLSGAGCVAVGERRDEAGARQAVVQRWDGSVWTAEAPPGGKNLVKVSCATAVDCVALEEPRFAGGLNRRVAVRSSTGWQWIGFAVPDESVEVTSVSCASSTWCLLTGANREVAVVESGAVRWIGRTPLSVSAVACTSSTSCAAAGGSAFLDWDGTRWATTALDAAGFVNDVDCWADQRCLATVSDDNGATSSYARAPGSVWAASGTPDGGPAFNDYGQPGLDCESGGSCHLLRHVGSPRSPELILATWAAGTWTSHTLPATDEPVTALGCRPVECVAATVGVTASGLPSHSTALHGSGDRWTSREMVNPLGRIPGYAPHEASCAARDWCLVLGVSGPSDPTFGPTTLEPYVVRSDGARWRELPAALVDQRDLDCWHPGECVVVGSDGKRPRSALLADGRWRLLPAPSAPWMAGGAITGVSCIKARCAYSGFYEARKDAGTGVFVALRRAGGWQVERLGTLFRGEGRFTGRPSMDCPTVSHCVVVTSMRLPGDKETTSFEATLVDGRWRWARLGASFSLYEVDCADARQCVAGGQEDDGPGLIMARSGDGPWRRVGGSPRNVGYTSVSCPTSDTCQVAGDRKGLQLLTRSGAGWSARAAGPRRMSDVACSGPRWCLTFNASATWVGR